MRSNLTTIARLGVLAAFVVGLSVSSPAFAQSHDNQTTGYQSEFSGGNTVGGAPQLKGAGNSTIGPQGQDATEIRGVNTAGTVRVNNLANLEALLNIIANGLEVHRNQKPPLREVSGWRWRGKGITFGAWAFGELVTSSLAEQVGVAG